MSPGEKRIAAGDVKGNLLVWDLESENTLRTVQVHGERRNSDGLAFSPNGKRIASVSAGGELVVADARSCQIEFRLQLDGWLRKVSFSPDGRWIATGAGDRSAFIVNATSGEIATRFPTDGGASVPTFDPGGQRIYTGGRNGSIKVWSWDGKQLAEVDAWAQRSARISNSDTSNRRTTSLEISSDGTRLVSTSKWPCIAEVWDTGTGERLAELDTGDIVYWSAFGRDREEVAFFSISDGIRFWRWNWRKQEDERIIRVLDGAVKATFDTGGKRILASTPMYFHGGFRPLMHRFPPEPAVIVSSDLSTRMCKLDESVYEASWSADGRHIVATLASDDAIRSYDVTTGRRLHSFPFTPELTISRIRHSGRNVMTFSKQGTLRSMNLAPREERVQLIRGQGWASAASFSREAELIAFSNFNFDVQIWATDNATRISQFSTPGHWVKRLIFSHDGDHLYAGGHGGLLMKVDVATGQEEKRFVGHGGAVLGIALSPDGRQLVSGDNSSGQVLIWDVETGRHFLTLANRAPTDRFAGLEFRWTTYRGRQGRWYGAGLGAAQLTMISPIPPSCG